MAPIDSLLRQELDELVASMCKALNDSKRLLLLYALRYGRYTVTEVECLGFCGTAPVVQINNDYLENMNVEKMDAWIRSRS